MEENVHPLAKFIRLQNGDDIIAETIETEDEDGILYTVFHPLKVVYMSSEGDGYLSVAFMPWVFPKICDQQEFVIHAEDILLVVDVSEQMNTYYWDSIDSHMNKRYNEEKQEEQNIEENKIEEESLQDILRELSDKRTYH